MKSEDRWLKGQVEIAKRVISGEIYNDVVDVEIETDLAAMILSTICHPDAVVEW